MNDRRLRFSLAVAFALTTNVVFDFGYLAWQRQKVFAEIESVRAFGISVPLLTNSWPYPRIGDAFVTLSLDRAGRVKWGDKDIGGVDDSYEVQEQMSARLGRIGVQRLIFTVIRPE